MQPMSAEELSLEQLTAGWNLVYTDYLVPMQMTPTFLQQHIEASDIRLDLSPLLLNEQGEIVGLAVLGLRADRGWIGGFGIAPAFRGQGLSHQLLSSVQLSAHAAGVVDLGLEVLTNNHAAIATYRHGGFSWQRDLLILTRSPQQPLLQADTSAISSVDPAVLLDSIRSFPRAAPCWQREAANLYNNQNLALAIGDSFEPAGYVIYRPGTQSVRMIDLAAHEPTAVQALVAALVQQYPDLPLMLVNEPENSPTLPTLFACGFRETMRQHEMSWHIAD